MSFTYDLDSDTGIVRFHIGDTREDEALFTDEEIAYALTEAGSVGPAVISLLLRQLADLSRQVDFSTRDLRVQHETALKGLKMLLSEKRRVFGIYSTPQAEAVAVSRSDTHRYGEERLEGIDPDRKWTYRDYE